MDPRRLADVRSGDADQHHSLGSGYLIAPRLVLTARHAVVERATDALWPRVDVRVGHPGPEHGTRERRAATVCWMHPGGRDVALLLLEAPVEVPGAVRWGRPGGTTPLPYAALGFPSAVVKADGRRNVEYMEGTLPPLAGGAAPNDRYVLNQGPAPARSSDSEQAWGGASGSAVFCHEHLVGVVVHDDDAFENRRLHACPAYSFTDDPEFARLLQEYGDGPPRMVRIDAAQRELEAVERWTDRFLSDPRVKTQLGGHFSVNRGRLMAELTRVVETHEQVLVTGPAGTGKSALARAVAQALRKQGVPVVGLSLTEHEWRTPAEIDATVGARLDTVLTSAPTGRRVLLVDGAEQVLADSGDLLRHLVSLLRQGEDGRATWHVVAVAREQAASAVRQCLADAGGRVEQVEVSGLDDGEVRKVLANFKALRPLDRLPRPARLLRNLYTVELLVQLVAAGADTGGILGEEDVADCVYEKLVRRGDGGLRGQGGPDDRSKVYLALADAVIDGETFAEVPTGTGEAPAGLVSDGVLVRDRAGHAFAHDVQQDYAIALRLGGPRPPDIAAAPRPRRLLRGIRLWAQMLLADTGRRSPAALAGAWEDVTETMQRLGERDGSRWAEVPFEALFELGRAGAVMADLSDLLLADGGRGLVKAAGRRIRQAETIALMLNFLLAHCDELDRVAADGALEQAAAWFPTISHTTPELASRVPAAVAVWYEGGSEHATAAAVALAWASEHLDNEARALLTEIAEQHPLSVQRVLEEKDLAVRMARHEPELLAKMARAFYLGQPSHPIRDREGVRDIGWPVLYHPRWDPRPTVPDPAGFGPFSTLLKESEKHGLALVGQITDAATAAVTTRSRLRRGDVTITWPRVGGNVIYAGTTMVWQWAWAGSPGPGPAIAALAAVRQWAHDRAAAGAPLARVVDQVLGCGASIGLVSVVVDVLFTHAARVEDELDPALGQLTTWLMPPSPGTRIAEVLPRLVLTATPERQDDYRRLSRDLTAAYEAARHVPPGLEERGHAWDDTIPKVAAYLDSSNYRTVELPEGKGRFLVNEAVLRIHTVAEAAQQMIDDRFQLSMDAQRARDRSDDVDVRELLDRFATVEADHQHTPPPDDPWKLEDIAALVAVVVLRAARAGAETGEQGPVQWAAHELVRAATCTTPALQSGIDVIHVEMNPQAGDRSAAMGLPLLLGAPELRAKAALSGNEIRAAIQQLAGSAFIEVRSALADTLDGLWQHTGCTGPDDTAHTASLAALAQMVASSGLGPEDGVYTARQHQQVTEPLDGALRSGAPVLDLRLAAPAVAVLHHAADADCAHGRKARSLFEALSDHDRLTWNTQPGAMAAHSHLWRSAHDHVAAAEALDGDRRRLDSYLEAFAPHPEALVGILHAMAHQATTRAATERLLQLWPGLLDRLASRNGSQELGRALLPLPTSGVRWPRSARRTITATWVTAMKSRPSLADHLIDVLEAHGVYDAPSAEQVLDVLGPRAAAVAVMSHKAVSFLSRVLSDDNLRTRPAGDRARALLDGIADTNRREALDAQRYLEESPERE
ncbi:AAA family ATPase [Streptomyces sp. BRB081]|nr:AAA family ATPase [Streptomyces sp. BRB081]